MQVGKIIGMGMFAGATAAVWYWPKGGERVAEPEAVRPVMSVVVQDRIQEPDLHFAAKVKAHDSRVLAFKQSGKILRIPVDNGSEVKKGDKLAWLDPVDYENKLAAAKANAEKNRLTYERKKAASKHGGVSQNEVSQAEAAMKSTDAAEAIARQALEETVIYAPFNGVVAKKFADELEIVDAASGSKKVMLLQDTKSVKIDAMLPETFMIGIKRLQCNSNDEACVWISFDAFPDKRYAAKFCEYQSTSEDNENQTYIATYAMKTPDDLVLMPGMSATLTVPGDRYSVRRDIADGCRMVPESAVGAASDGSHYVWVLVKDGEDGVYVAQKRTIEVMNIGGKNMLVKNGLKGGERIATSGVTLLRDGRKVTLMDRGR